MANLKGIKTRIQSTESIRKITRTMEMISTVRSTQATRRLRQARPYKQAVHQLLALTAKAVLSKNLNTETLRFFSKPGKVETVSLIVLGADRGLCGGFNMQIHRKAQEVIEQYSKDGIKCRSYLFGKKLQQYFRFIRLTFQQGYLSAEETELLGLVEPLLAEFTTAKTDRIEIISTVYEDAARQSVRHQTLLPFAIETKAKTQTETKVKDTISESTNIEEQSPGQIAIMIQELAAQAVRALLLNLHIETQTSEHLARRIAMKNGTDAANDMLGQLRQDFNRKRQAAITQEISEIVAGSTAS